NGHGVVVGDASAEQIERARSGLARTLDRLVDRGRLERSAAAAGLARIDFVDTGGGPLTPFASCDLVIEAIVERLDAKQAAFRALEAAVGNDAVLATNTSSLSIASIAGACERPSRVLGVHFFNP